jgi:regulator of CtrA degradation
METSGGPLSNGRRAASSGDRMAGQFQDKRPERLADAAGGKMVALSERRAASEHFQAMYRKGMALVEETAHYLDGEGRAEAKDLAKAPSILYASESMRLTTRLMQLASWLLLQRAANSGEMTVKQVMQERTKVRLATPSDVDANPAVPALPARFRDLVDRSLVMERDIRRMDEELYGERAAQIGAVPETNAVSEQIALLRTAFGG